MTSWAAVPPRPPGGALTVEALMEALDDAVIGYAVADAAGRVLSASTPFRRIAAVSEAALASGEPWFVLDTAPASTKRLRAEGWRAFRATGRGWKGWVRWHLPNGRVRFFEGTARPVGADRYVMIANDRSDRIEADQALEESEDVLRGVLGELPLNVALLSPDGTVEYTNEFLPRSLDKTAAEVIGHRFDEIEGLTFDSAVVGRIRAGIVEERPIDEVEVAMREGTLTGTTWQLVGRPLRHRTGRMRHYLVVSIDRTDERRLLDERREFAAALAESQKVRALNDFAGSLAHELSNVLHPVGVYARQLQRQPSGPEAWDFAGRIDAAVRDAGRILRRTLTMARSGAEAPRRVDLSAVIGEVIDSARDFAPDLVRYDAELGTEKHALCEPTELRQVMLNLLNNAVQAQGHSGTIRVRIDGPVAGPHGSPVAPTAPGPFLVVTVADEGVGMDPATLKRVFEPFFTLKEGGRGTGLGLPVVMGLTTGWGGTVSVESSLGKGSAFRVWIPAWEAEGPDREEVPQWQAY